MAALAARRPRAVSHLDAVQGEALTAELELAGHAPELVEVAVAAGLDPDGMRRMQRAEGHVQPQRVAVLVA